MTNAQILKNPFNRNIQPNEFHCANLLIFSIEKYLENYRPPSDRNSFVAMKLLLAADFDGKNPEKFALLDDLIEATACRHGENYVHKTYKVFLKFDIETRIKVVSCLVSENLDCYSSCSGSSFPE